MKQLTRRPCALTYFSQRVADIAAEQKLLEQWRENWKVAGYEPVVLNEFQLLRDPTAIGWLARLAKFPSPDPKAPPTTFLKWFAAAIACPHDAFCMVASYNVFNYGFVPDMNVGRLGTKGSNVGFETGTSNVFFAGKPGLLKQCALFGDYTPPATATFVTDLDVLKHQETNFPGLWESIDVCRPYGDLTGWEEAKLVRYSSADDPKKLRDWTPKEDAQ